jgi:hypothetical protein
MKRAVAVVSCVSVFFLVSLCFSVSADMITVKIEGGRGIPGIYGYNVTIVNGYDTVYVDCVIASDRWMFNGNDSGDVIYWSVPPSLTMGFHHENVLRDPPFFIRVRVYAGDVFVQRWGIGVFGHVFFFRQDHYIEPVSHLDNRYCFMYQG